MVTKYNNTHQIAYDVRFFPEVTPPARPPLQGTLEKGWMRDNRGWDRMGGVMEWKVDGWKMRMEGVRENMREREREGKGSWNPSPQGLCEMRPRLSGFIRDSQNFQFYGLLPIFRC
jgi:hypothetical protein